MPIARAPSVIARSSSTASWASTSVSRPSCVGRSEQLAETRRRRGRGAAGGRRPRRPPSPCAGPRRWEEALREQRHVRRGARGAQVVPRPAEALVDEHRDSAPRPRARSRRERAGSASGRRSPADGERRLTSAIAPSPGALRASRNRPMSLESTRRAARGARPRRRSRAASRGELEPFAEVGGVPGRGDRAGGVEQDRVARAAVAAGEDAADARGVLVRRAAAQLLRIAARDAELERVDLAPLHLAVDDLATRFGPAGESSSIPPAPWTTNARRAPSCASTSAIVRTRSRRVDADDLRARARRVRQRAEHVEDRPRRELAAHRRGVPHRRMVRRREHEAEAELVDRARDPLRRELELEAERLEHVGRAGRRRHRPVAVLRHRSAGRRRDERRRGRDVRACARRRRPSRPCRRGRRASGGLAPRARASPRPQPAISSAVSPLARSATRKPPICAGVASPRMISSMTARASERVRLCPSSTRVSACCT